MENIEENTELRDHSFLDKSKINHIYMQRTSVVFNDIYKKIKGKKLSRILYSKPLLLLFALTADIAQLSRIKKHKLCYSSTVALSNLQFKYFSIRKWDKKTRFNTKCKTFTSSTFLQCFINWIYRYINTANYNLHTAFPFASISWSA